MRARTVFLGVVITVLALGAGACGEEDDEDGVAEVASNAVERFEPGTMMAELADAGAITIGVKTDQPGLGFQAPGADAPTGLDVEIAKLIAAKLGIEPGDIEWVETVTENREAFLQNGNVDLIAATYSITPERLAIVGQAGPYYVTGQQLLVREEDQEAIAGPDDLDGRKVCSVTGSTSIKTITEEYGAKPIPFNTYSECVQQLLNGQVDAVTTDGAILLGYEAEQPDELEVVGPEFSEERYGVGYPKQASEMCDFITSTLRESFSNGDWEEAFARTLGEAGVEAPAPPKLDACGQ